MTKGDDHLVYNNTVFSWDRPEKWADWVWQITSDISILEREGQNLVTRSFDNVVDVISGDRWEDIG